MALNISDPKLYVMYHVKNDNELYVLLDDLLKERGPDADLNDIDVSNIETFDDMFVGLDPRNIDISQWDMSNAKSCYRMFYKCKRFNCDLSEWDVRNVTTFRSMFNGCEVLDFDASNWKPDKEATLSNIFKDCPNMTIPQWAEKTNL